MAQPPTSILTPPPGSTSTKRIAPRSSSLPEAPTSSFPRRSTGRTHGTTIPGSSPTRNLPGARTTRSARTAGRKLPTSRSAGRSTRPHRLSGIPPCSVTENHLPEPQRQRPPGHYIFGTPCPLGAAIVATRAAVALAESVRAHRSGALGLAELHGSAAGGGACVLLHTSPSLAALAKVSLQRN